MKSVNIGICGVGTVGTGTLDVLSRNTQEISARAGKQINIVHVGARRDHKDDHIRAISEDITISRDVFAVVNDKNVDVVVELIGGTSVAKDLVEQALQNGKHVVTANKALIAQHGNELFALAEKNNVVVAYEAAVAGGIPIIKALKEGLSANKIEFLAGIINGTGNFILTEMRDKKSAFGDVLAQAQALGYAEADPTFDIEGIDAAHKLVILSAIAFGTPLQFDSVFTEGITKITTADVDYAKELGYEIKHLGVTQKREGGIELRVHPTLVPTTEMIANVNGVMNAVMVKGDAVGPTLYYGPGAGAEPTASAVIADIVDVVRNSDDAPNHCAPHLGFDAASLNALPMLPIEEVETAFYIRMTAQDKPGVLSEITQILSNAGISIEALVQKEPNENEETVPVILLTQRVIEKQVIEAIQKIEALDTISDSVMRIRVETFK